MIYVSYFQSILLLLILQHTLVNTEQGLNQSVNQAVNYRYIAIFGQTKGHIMEVDEVVSQFGCMQTHDQDDLVNQMLRLVGANMNMSAARFYLEMNQWNVQAAVCSYFDLESANFNLPTMVFLADITIGEGESVPPNTPFVKTWRVENPGPDPWPPGTILR